LPIGASRSGGFGGAAGLATYLQAEQIDLLVDATHPFADQITANAAEAASMTSVPRLLLDRPAWEPVSGDRWLHARDIDEAAALLPGLAARVFLTIGRQDLGAFAHLDRLWFLYRMIEAPSDGAPSPPGHLLLDRGPFTEQSERDLTREYRLETVVTRNSGGDETYPKIAAARALGLPVVMVDRPPLPPGETVRTPAEALTWMLARASGVR
jgi:precorrin-6A/cobalt-precorrin-6A reductase